MHPLLLLRGKVTMANMQRHESKDLHQTNPLALSHCIVDFINLKFMLITSEREYILCKNSFFLLFWIVNKAELSNVEFSISTEQRQGKPRRSVRNSGEVHHDDGDQWV